MATANSAPRVSESTAAHSGPVAEILPAVAVATTIAAVHLVTNGRYGFHRDELQVLSDARHLDWGFVVYPPFTPVIERIAMALFGLSIRGLRVFSVVAQFVVVMISADMARQLGGRRLAQFTTALAVALAPLALFEGTEFQYTSFDYLWWVLAAYFAVRLLKSEDPRWCMAVGACIGMGVETKYTIFFFLAGVVGAFVLTPARRYLRTRWFWLGVALAAVIFLPNFIWQVRYQFISVHFLQHIHTRDIGEGRTAGFWPSQLLVCVDAVAVPLAIAGLAGFALNRRYRTLAWMYAIPVVVLWLAKGRGYYAGAVYPMLIAMGAVMFERTLRRLSQPARVAVAAVYLAAIAAPGVYVSLVIIPWTNGGPLKARALAHNEDLRQEIGWDELVTTVATIRDSFAPEQRASVGVLVGNYGEQGAIEILGQRYGLPAPISGTNSAWYRSYPQRTPSALIVIGFSQKGAESAFESCRLAGHNGNSLGIHNEESDDHPDIFVCRQPRLGWQEFWKKFQRFG